MYSLRPGAQDSLADERNALRLPAGFDADCAQGACAAELHLGRLEPAARQWFLMHLSSIASGCCWRPGRAIDPDLRASVVVRATVPGSTDEVRDEGLVLHQLGRRAEAAELLRMYLRLEPRAPDAPMVGAALLD